MEPPNNVIKNAHSKQNMNIKTIDIGDLDCWLSSTGVTNFENPRWRLNRAKIIERHREKPCFLHFASSYSFRSRSITLFWEELTGVKVLDEYLLQSVQFTNYNSTGQDWAGLHSFAHFSPWFFSCVFLQSFTSFSQVNVIYSNYSTYSKSYYCLFCSFILISTKLQYFHLKILGHFAILF